MGASYKALARRGNRKSKSGEYTIKIRVTLHRRTIFLNTGERIHERYWSGSYSTWVKPSHPGANKINLYLSNMINRLHNEEWQHKAKTGNQPSLSQIKDFFFRNFQTNSSSFNDYVADYLTNHMGDLKPGTHKKYKTFMKHFNAFNTNVA